MSGNDLRAHGLEFCYAPASAAFRSASTVVVGLIANFSTSTFSTAGVTNAGSVGPRRMLLMPRWSRVSRMAHGLLLIPGKDQRERQIVDAAAERLGQRAGDLDGGIGVVALAAIQQARNAADVAEIQLVEAILAAGQRQDRRSPWAPLRRIPCSSCGPACAPSQPPIRKKCLICAGLDRVDHFVRNAQNRRCGRSRRGWIFSGASARETRAPPAPPQSPA